MSDRGFMILHSGHRHDSLSAAFACTAPEKPTIVTVDAIITNNAVPRYG